MWIYITFAILQLPNVFDSEVDHFPNCKSRRCWATPVSDTKLTSELLPNAQHEFCFTSMGAIFTVNIRSKLKGKIKIKNIWHIHDLFHPPTVSVYNIKNQLLCNQLYSFALVWVWPCLCWWWWGPQPTTWHLTLSDMRRPGPSSPHYYYQTGSYPLLLTSLRQVAILSSLLLSYR